MQMNELIGTSVGARFIAPIADYVLSKINMDYEIGPNTVTLSEAKGLSRWA